MTKRDERIYTRSFIKHLAENDPERLAQMQPEVDVAVAEGRVVEALSPAAHEAEVARILRAGAPTVREVEFEALSAAERQQRAPELTAAIRSGGWVPTTFHGRRNDRNWSLKQLEAEEDGEPRPPPRLIYERDLQRMSHSEREEALAAVKRKEASVYEVSQGGRRGFGEAVTAAQKQHADAVAEWRKLTGQEARGKPRTPGIESLSTAELVALLDK
jgi:hypothetical protein